MNYNYIIVEDNLGCLQNLRTALKSHNNFSEVGVASTLTKGISLILSLKPHVIFLDVQLGVENGFDLIKEIRQYTIDFPFIIITTDYEKYAKKAVNFDVLYFLDKPIDEDELIIALNKFEKRVFELQKNITIKNSDGHFFLQLDEISYLKSDNNCCIIFKVNSTSMFVTKTLKEMESILPLPFLRIHKSYIVNAKYIQSCVQRISATRDLVKCTSFGVLYPNFLTGLLLSFISTSLISLSDTSLKSVFFGKNLLITPFLFSMLPLS